MIILLIDNTKEENDLGTYFICELTCAPHIERIVPSAFEMLYCKYFGETCELLYIILVSSKL